VTDRRLRRSWGVTELMAERVSPRARDIPAEIARVLGMSESNAGTRLHRTMAKLREA